MTPGWDERTRIAALDDVHELAKMVAADVRQNIRRGGLISSGALLKSVRVRRRVSSSVVEIGTDHWQYIEYGTKAHTLIAAPGQVFTFVKANGERVFTTRIRVPARRAHAVLRRALFKYRRARGVTFSG